jgi:hypothetical protein
MNCWSAQTEQTPPLTNPCAAVQANGQRFSRRMGKDKAGRQKSPPPHGCKKLEPHAFPAAATTAAATRSPVVTFDCPSTACRRLHPKHPISEGCPEKAATRNFPIYTPPPWRAGEREGGVCAWETDNRGLTPIWRGSEQGWGGCLVRSPSSRALTLSW